MKRKLGKCRRMELAPRSAEVLKESVSSHREGATGCQLALKVAADRKKHCLKPEREMGQLAREEGGTS